MREALESKVSWDDVDEKTFSRFASFVYRRDYDVEQGIQPIPKEAKGILPLSPELPRLPILYTDPPSFPFPQNMTLGIDFPCSVGSYLGEWNVSCPYQFHVAPMKRRPPRYMYMSAFKSLKGPGDACPGLIMVQTVGYYQVDQSYTDIFLAHARMYVLADKYCIDSLLATAWTKMYTTLYSFVPTPRRVADLIPVVRFIYANTMPDDKMRLLLAFWTACFVDVLRNDNDFKAELTENLEFNSDVIAAICKSMDHMD
ncbi:hypothetical protein QBC46DRAFT_400354 [Diplogelasinospora grovesii]|uniref:Uncharacterized protein n=1 Tax=Diplogelasinospora grovesii TaxID=303347 RepID=A0AAN6MYK5_9PEZI|nr:hypothetical protein QBC46DRAFT_400354 [Diplogelasinospora grovesii]